MAKLIKHQQQANFHLIKMLMENYIKNQVKKQLKLFVKTENVKFLNVQMEFVKNLKKYLRVNNKKY